MSSMSPYPIRSKREMIMSPDQGVDSTVKYLRWELFKESVLSNIIRLNVCSEVRSFLLESLEGNGREALATAFNSSPSSRDAKGCEPCGVVARLEYVRLCTRLDQGMIRRGMNVGSRGRVRC